VSISAEQRAQSRPGPAASLAGPLTVCIDGLMATRCGGGRSRAVASAAVGAHGQSSNSLLLMAAMNACHCPAENDSFRSAGSWESRTSRRRQVAVTSTHAAIEGSLLRVLLRQTAR
jgi:hypothetical protein